MPPTEVSQTETDFVPLLDRAIRTHQAGRLTEAAALYQQILASQPTHPEATHLLGVVEHQQGRHGEAIALIRRAVEGTPANAIFRSNLGLALRAAGQRVEAAEQLRSAVTLDPAYSVARRNLGTVLQELGQLDEAAEHLRMLVEGSAADKGAWFSLAVVRLKQGQNEEGARLLRQVLTLDPNDASAHNNLGIALKDLGRHPAGEEHLRRAIALKPDSADFHSNLAQILSEQGQFQEAIAAAHEALRCNPHAVMARNHLAVALKQVGDLAEAEQQLRRALLDDPQDVATLTNLGDILTLRDCPREALGHLLDAVRLDPNCAEAHNNLAVTLKELNREPEGIPHLERSLELNPRYTPALNNLANARIAAGQVADGTALLIRALEIAPNDVPALYGLATNTKHELSDEEVQQLEALLGQPRLSVNNRELIHFALATVRDQKRSPAAAFENALAANRLKKASYRRRGLDFDQRRHLAFVAEIMEVFSRGAFDRWPNSGLETEEPLFVLGMPRSGTTLVEQILASHPRVFGAGELNDFAQMAADLPARLRDPVSFPRCVTRLDANVLRQLADDQLRRLRDLGGSAARIVDKMTINFLYLGLIALVFPKARIVHCRRDPRDTCLSCFFHNFAAPGMNFTFDLEDLGFYYRQYERLMEHWRRVLPLRMFEIQYEELVQDQEACSRKLIEFCGLDWDERCLSFHKTNRPVKTASSLQVRQPIYTKSVGRWKPYEQQLQPLIHRLSTDEPSLARESEDFDVGLLANFVASPCDSSATGSPTAELSVVSVQASRKEPSDRAAPSLDRQLQDLFAEGLRSHQAGNLAQALGCYREVLRQQPHHAESWHLFGVLQHQQGNHAEALESIQRAIALEPTDAAFHSNVGLVLRALQRLDEAAAALNQALQIDPEYVGALRNLCVVLRELQRFSEAEAGCRRLLKLLPNDAAAWRSLGTVLLELRRLDEAESAMRQAVALNPADADAHNHLGVILKDLKRFEDSEASHREALRLRPDNAAAHNNLGILLTSVERSEEALTCFQEALRLKPDFADARHNWGAALADLGRHAEAIEHFQFALARNGHNPEYHNSLGASLQVLGRLSEAMASYDQALRLDPQHVWAHFNRSQAYLLLGQYETGWSEWEWRWKRPGAPQRDYLKDRPAWDGSPLPHGTILLDAEQGLGDTLQFVRFAKLVRQRVGRVILQCQAPLLPLLRRCSDIDTLVARGEPLPPFDVHASLMSLPGVFRVAQDTVPADVPYLSASPELIEKWKERLAQFPGLKIGIAWQGNPKYKRDRFRSISLPEFAPLAEVSGMTWISLQKGPGQEQLRNGSRPSSLEIVDLGNDVDEAAGAFMDTAAILKNLDLLITSDTALPHLAGAFGVPTWLAVAHSPDWRWQLTGTTSPWYPNMRLFRQPAIGDWHSVFTAMRDELQSLAKPDTLTSDMAISMASESRPALATATNARTPTASHISVPISPGELIDKITICQIKTERMTDPVKLRNVNHELSLLLTSLEQSVPASPELSERTAKLKEINEKLWVIEDDIRDCERHHDFSSRFIELARAVYISNDVRSTIKRQINDLLNSPLVEEKSYAKYD